MRHSKSRIVTDLVTGRGLFAKKDAAEDARVDELLDALNLTTIQHSAVVGLPLGTSPAASRSVGPWRRIPKVMLMDEPSSGSRRAESPRTLRRHSCARSSRDHGVSLLFVEHDVPMVLGALRLTST